LSDEERMRHALGLDNASAAAHSSNSIDRNHRPRRFVKDGEIPVVLLNAGRDRQPSPNTTQLAETEAALRTEQVARATAERALADALATIQRLRTQLAHTEMAHAETLEAERVKCEALNQALLEAADTRERLQEQLARQAATSVTQPEALRTTTAQPTPAAQQNKPRKRHAAADREAEPVKWWLPSYKARFGKQAAKSRR
jgi:hypothetical protein